MNKSFKRIFSGFLTVFLLISMFDIIASAEGELKLEIDKSVTVTLATDETVDYSFTPAEEGNYKITVNAIDKAIATATLYPANKSEALFGTGEIVKTNHPMEYLVTPMLNEFYSGDQRYGGTDLLYVNAKAGNEINLSIADQTALIKSLSSDLASYFVPSTVEIIVEKTELKTIDTNTARSGIGDEECFEFIPEESGVYTFKTINADGANAKLAISDYTGIIAKTPDMSSASEGADDGLNAELQKGETYLVLCTNMATDDSNETIGTCGVEVEAPVASKISNITYEKSLDTHNTFNVTVDGRPAMVQFIEPDGGTRTYDRSNKNVSIKSYDAEGNEVNSLDRNLAYEVWSIYSNMSAGVEIKTRAKYLNAAIYTWDSVKYSFTVELLEPVYDAELRSITPSETAGKKGAVLTTVVTGPDAQGVRFVMEDGSTCTYDISKATVLDNGDLQFVGKAWANELGVNTITVQVKVSGKWQYASEFQYKAE